MRRLAPLLAAVSLLLQASSSIAQEEPATSRLRVTHRIAIVAANDEGGPGRAPLLHAADDARAIADVLLELGGVQPAGLRLLSHARRHDVEEALARSADELEAARVRGERTELLVYYSGHSDEDGLWLGPDAFPYDALRADVAQLNADVRLVVLDACSSGALVRGKGGRRRPPFVVDDAVAVTGQAFLTSSAADEASQESDRLGGSYFTHALVSGLRGAADASGDGRVTLTEAYQFAFAETLARTERSVGGAQHAGWDIQLSGAGDLVLTDLRDRVGRIEWADALDGRAYVKDLASGRVVAEARKQAGVPLRFAVVPGAYELTLAGDGTARGVRVDVRDVPVHVDAAMLGDVVLERAIPRGLLPLSQFPINLAFLTPLEVNSYAPRPHNALGLHLLFGRSARLSGAALSLGGSWVDERAWGGMLSLGFNGTAGPMSGLQLALANLALDDVTGAQIGGAINLGLRDSNGGVVAPVNFHTSLHGAQVGLVNIGGDVVGAQVGLVNIARRVTGAQVGLVNIARTSTVPVGVVSVIGDGQARIGVTSSDFAPLGVEGRLGGRFVWTIVGAGVVPSSSSAAALPTFVVGGGIGGTIPVRRDLDVDLVLSSGARIGNAGATTTAVPWGELSGRASWRVFPWLSLHLGPAVRLLADDGSAPVWAMHAGPVVLWPGLTFGASL